MRRRSTLRIVSRRSPASSPSTIGARPHGDRIVPVLVRGAGDRLERDVVHHRVPLEQRARLLGERRLRTRSRTHRRRARRRSPMSTRPFGLQDRAPAMRAVGERLDVDGRQALEEAHAVTAGDAQATPRSSDRCMVMAAILGRRLAAARCGAAPRRRGDADRRRSRARAAESARGLPCVVDRDERQVRLRDVAPGAGAHVLGLDPAADLHRGPRGVVDLRLQHDDLADAAPATGSRAGRSTRSARHRKHGASRPRRHRRRSTAS